MMQKVQELSTGQAPRNDVEKAKSYILDNIADAITVKDVGDIFILSKYLGKMGEIGISQFQSDHSNGNVGMCQHIFCRFHFHQRDIFGAQQTNNFGRQQK